MLKHTHTQPANMCYVAFVSVSRSGNEAVLMCSVFRVCLSESCVKCEVFCYGGGRTKNVMKEALPAVKRIQCKVEVRIQLALWAP